MLNRNLEKFKRILRTENLKFTPQRHAVFKEICSCRDHREAEQIYLTLRERKVNVSRATVYRTMDLLHKYGLVRRMDAGDGKWRYEHWLDCSHHDHILCIRCGKIIEFLSPEIEELQDKVCKKFDYELVRHIHQLFGFCPECQRSVA